MPKRYNLNVVCNTPTEEHDYSFKASSLDKIVALGLKSHPDCTSMVITLTFKGETEDAKA